MKWPLKYGLFLVVLGQVLLSGAEAFAAKPTPTPTPTPTPAATPTPTPTPIPTPTLKSHRFRFFISPSLTQGLPDTEVKSRLSLYVRDLNAIFSKQTIRRFTFNPDTDITITDSTPYVGGLNRLPEDNYEVWAHVKLTDKPDYGSYGGFAASDVGGAGVAAGLRWDAIHDPATMGAREPSSRELQQYWHQLHNLIHEVEHIFGAGTGEYYNVRMAQDRTSVAPFLDLDIGDPADSYWSKHTDYFTDPLIVWTPTTLSYAELMGQVRFANVTVALINKGGRNPDTEEATLPDMANTKVWVRDAAGNAVPNSTVRIWAVAGHQSLYAEPLFEGTTASDGSFTFPWVHHIGLHHRLLFIKAQPPVGAPAATWCTIFDAQEQKMVFGKNTMDINLTLPGAAPEELSIGSAIVTEGDSSPAYARFPVTLWPPRNEPVTVNYAMLGPYEYSAHYSDVAAQDVDYTGAAGTLTFAPGETSKTVTVEVLGDVLPEKHEVYALGLSNATGARITRATGFGTILDNDYVTDMKINDIIVEEGDGGTPLATFTVTLSIPLNQKVDVDWATFDGPAKAGEDYVASSGHLTFGPGETSKILSVPVIGDTTVEPIERFGVLLSNLTAENALYARILDGQGVCAVRSNDAYPTGFSINDVAVTEGASGTSTAATFTVRLSAASSQNVSVKYATANGSASSRSDYSPASGMLTFAPGETTKTVTVLVQGDNVVEPDETFTVNLSRSTGPAIGDAVGVGTILRDD